MEEHTSERKLAMLNGLFFMGLAPSLTLPRITGRGNRALPWDNKKASAVIERSPHRVPFGCGYPRAPGEG